MHPAVLTAALHEVLGGGEAIGRRRLESLLAGVEEVQEKVQRDSGERCVWRRPYGASAAGNGDVLVSPNGRGVHRRGRGVYRNAQLGAQLEVMDGAAWARYAEVHVETGGGICVGVGVVGEVVGGPESLIGMKGESVGFHDSGKLVRGTGNWQGYVCGYGEGDVVGALVCGGGEIEAEDGVVDGMLSTSAACSLGRGSPGSSVKGEVGRSLSGVLGGDSAGVTVRFSVNGVFGDAVPLRAVVGASVAVVVSLYGNAVRVRGACCEGLWRKFAAVAKCARPLCIQALCEPLEISSKGEAVGSRGSLSEEGL